MSYQILPNIIFILAVLGILLIILRHLPEAQQLEKTESQGQVRENLESKGIPAEAVSKIHTRLKLWFRKIWNFVLEAKDLKPGAVAGYKMKKIFKEKHKFQEQQAQKPASHEAPEEHRNEQYYLDAIKRDPKDDSNYDALGKFYTESHNFSDSRDIYLYLISHHPTNPVYQARLAYAFYRLKQYKKAAEHYKKSLVLDNSQPNRYYNLGLSLEAYGDKDGSVEAFEKALVLEPKNIKFYITLSNVFVKYGNRDRAKKLLLKAREIEPTNAEVSKKLQELA